MEPKRTFEQIIDRIQFGIYCYVERYGVPKHTIFISADLLSEILKEANHLVKYHYDHDYFEICGYKAKKSTEKTNYTSGLSYERRLIW